MNHSTSFVLQVPRLVALDSCSTLFRSLVQLRNSAFILSILCAQSQAFGFPEHHVLRYTRSRAWNPRAANSKLEDITCDLHLQLSTREPIRSEPTHASHRIN